MARAVTNAEKIERANCKKAELCHNVLTQPGRGRARERKREGETKAEKEQQQCKREAERKDKLLPPVHVAS